MSTSADEIDARRGVQEDRPGLSRIDECESMAAHRVGNTVSPGYELD